MMPSEVRETQWSQLSERIAERMGLHFPRERWDDLQRGLAGAALEFGFEDAAACVDWLLSAPLTQAQLQVLASHLTIGETYFFRNKQTLDALAGNILPELIRARRGRQVASEPGKGRTFTLRLPGDPDYQWLLRSSYNFSGGAEFDVMLRRVGSLPVQPKPQPRPDVPAYTAVDVRIGWKLTQDVELSLAAENLFNRKHAEFDTASEYGRRIFLKLLWRL